MRISYEFAYHQWGDPGNAGMYSHFPIKCMLPADYCVRIRQVSLQYNSRVLGPRTFREYFGQNGVNMGHDLGI